MERCEFHRANAADTVHVFRPFASSCLDAEVAFDATDGSKTKQKTQGPRLGAPTNIWLVNAHAEGDGGRYCLRCA